MDCFPNSLCLWCFPQTKSCIHRRETQELQHLEMRKKKHHFCFWANTEWANWSDVAISETKAMLPLMILIQSQKGWSLRKWADIGQTSKYRYWTDIQVQTLNRHPSTNIGQTSKYKHWTDIQVQLWRKQRNIAEWKAVTQAKDMDQ